MPKAVQIAAPEKILAKIKKLFEAPVLSSESLKDYYSIMLSFIECCRPRDAIEEMLIVDVTNSTWEARRYSVYKTFGDRMRTSAA